MTTILLPVIFTCRAQTKHICISHSAFLSPYLDSSQRSLKNVILCSSSLRLARPLLVSSSRCLVFYEPCHEPAPFYTKGGPSRRSHSEASRRFRGYSDWDGGGVKEGGGVWGGLALKFVCPYMGVESQVVPVTHIQSLPDSLTSSKARYRPHLPKHHSCALPWLSPAVLEPHWTHTCHMVSFGQQACFFFWHSKKI